MNYPSLELSEIKAFGESSLKSIHNPTSPLQVWIEKLLELSNQWKLEDDPYVWLSCLQAFLGVSEGNFGVGAILVDEKGDIMIQGHNKSFVPDFRSDLHAEMVILNEWEKQLSGPLENKSLNYKLYSSLEPCPMCFARLLCSDIKGIHYAAEDKLGGMVHRLEQMPPFFTEVAKRHEISRANASPDLLQAARDIMDISMGDLNQRIK